MVLPLPTARKVGLPGGAVPFGGSTRAATMLDVPSKSNGIEHARKGCVWTSPADRGFVRKWMTTPLI